MKKEDKNIVIQIIMIDFVEGIVMMRSPLTFYIIIIYLLIYRFHLTIITF